MAISIEKIGNYDFYSIDGIERDSDDDEIDFLEEGFMKGYLEADNIDR